MYKVNCKKSEAIAAMKQVLISDEMLFQFDVSKEGNSTVLTVEKETQKSEYKVFGDNQFNRMAEFLGELKNDLPTYLKEDVDYVLDEMESIF